MQTRLERYLGPNFPYVHRLTWILAGHVMPALGSPLDQAANAVASLHATVKHISSSSLLGVHSHCYPTCIIRNYGPAAQGDPHIRWWTLGYLATYRSRTSRWVQPVFLRIDFGTKITEMH
jgi:hypothetical protein